MKIMHLSDLHLGKRVNGFSMMEDQRFILNQIIEMAERERPECVVIAGDIYDKPVPPAEAVGLLDEFLVALLAGGRKVFVISGNHDSPERIAFGGRILETGGLYVSPVYRGEIPPIVLEDSYGEINLYLMPFIRPAHVRRYSGEERVETHSDAVRFVLGRMRIDTAKRNVLVAHQFVTGAARSESEEILVGGTDNVDGEIFECFDYTALGHIHRPQKVGGGHIRYCGTPLKYSFSEANQEKSVTLAELREKGQILVRTLPLSPLRDMAEIRGKYEEITLRRFYEKTTYQEDYLHITLTDEEDVPEAMGKLRAIYRNLMKLDYDNQRTRQRGPIEEIGNVAQISPGDIFREFYRIQNNREMTAAQEDYMETIISEVWEEEE